MPWKPVVSSKVDGRLRGGSVGSSAPPGSKIREDGAEVRGFVRKEKAELPDTPHCDVARARLDRAVTTDMGVVPAPISAGTMAVPPRDRQQVPGGAPLAAPRHATKAGCQAPDLSRDYLSELNRELEDLFGTTAPGAVRHVRPGVRGLSRVAR